MAPPGDITKHIAAHWVYSTGPNASSELGNVLRVSRILQENAQVARAKVPEVATPHLPRCIVRVQFWLVRASKKRARSHGWDHRNCATAERAARGAAIFSDRQPGRVTTPALGATMGTKRDSVNIRKVIRKVHGAIWRQDQAEMLRIKPRDCTGTGSRLEHAGDSPTRAWHGNSVSGVWWICTY